MRAALALLVMAVACGGEVPAPAVDEPVPTRVRVLTDTQYANAIRDLLGDVTPAFPVHVPGSRPHQFLHSDVVAIDAALLSQYRVAAESIGRDVAERGFSCPTGDDACARARIDDFATRAFRRPLEPGELEELVALYHLAPNTGEGWGGVVEAVLQAPSFVYRTELGAGSGRIELNSYELATELAFLFTDSIPDEALWTSARDGSLADPAVLASHVERLLAGDRVRAHLVDVILDWLEIRRVFDVAHVDPVLGKSMFDESARFVHDVLWNRGGSLRTLLLSPDSVVDRQLAEHYGLAIDADVGAISQDPTQRSGILTHASLLAAHGTPQISIIQRGVFVHRKLLCTEELGRPPFAAIIEVFDLTRELSESQFAHYREADLYCRGCHRVIDPPGRALLAFDSVGTWRSHDEIGIPVESDVRIEIDGVVHAISTAPELARLLAQSRQVAHCVVDQIANHALGTQLPDLPTRKYLYGRFEDNDRDLVDVFRAIATSPAFRMRGAP